MGDVLKLTFRDGVFELDTGHSKQQTLSLKAALRFRPHADKIAEKVFNRTLNRRYEVPSYLPPSFLDYHQMEGLDHALTRSRSYLAHAPGAGKTCVTIVTAILSKRFGLAPNVFIVPPTLTFTWAREILKWTEKFKIMPSIYVVGRTVDKDNADWGADFYVVPDSMLTKGWLYDKLVKLRPNVLSADEASRFKEPTAERTKALFGGVGERVYYGLIQNARHAILLDGSPMPNRPMELWAPCTAMDPSSVEYLDAHDFGVKYCAGRFKTEGFKNEWDYRGASNQELLRKNLRKQLMHVVTEDQLGHPERLRSMVFTDDVASREMKTWEQKHLKTLNLKDLDEDMSQGDIAAHRQQLGIKKVPFAISYIRERYEDKNESILIFAWHREVCRMLESGLRAYRPGVVMGGTPAGERERIFSEFQSGRSRLIIGNIGAMGRGHNLQLGKRICFVEYSWTDELNKQAEKRASRKGATAHAVRCDYIVVPNSMDEVVLNSVFTKAKNVKRVIG